jgi:hypothetical protein
MAGPVARNASPDSKAVPILKTCLALFSIAMMSSR